MLIKTVPETETVLETVYLIPVIRSDLYMFIMLQRVDVTQQTNVVFLCRCKQTGVVGSLLMTQNLC